MSASDERQRELDRVSDERQRELDRAFDELEREVPERALPFVRWLRTPASRKVRLPVGGFFMLGGVLWFVPGLGVEMLPIGLLIVAQDVPILKRPVARSVRSLNHHWVRLKQRNSRRKP